MKETHNSYLTMTPNNDNLPHSLIAQQSARLHDHVCQENDVIGCQSTLFLKRNVGDKEAYRHIFYNLFPMRKTQYVIHYCLLRFWNNFRFF